MRSRRDTVNEPTTHVLFDAANHYFEPAAAFSRYLDPKVYEGILARLGSDRTLTGHAVHRVLDGTSNELPIGGDRAPIAANAGLATVPDSHWNREARLEVMNTQGLERAWFFPMLATSYEDRLRADPDSVMQLLKAFNRWLEEAWGFAYQDRIFAAPYLSLADASRAVDELQWCLDHDARVVMIRPAAPWTSQGRVSPTSPHYDRFWALAQEAGITISVHAAETGYARQGYVTDDPSQGASRPEQLIWSHLHQERPIFDFLAATLVDRLFVRFPGLRLASVENGARFLPELISKVTTVRDAHAGWFEDDPSDLLREHVWVAPDVDDDVNEAIDLLGVDRVLFGSGWPRPAGLASPSDYAGEVAHLPKDAQTAILHKNADFLNQRLPMSATVGFNQPSL